MLTRILKRKMSQRQRVSEANVHNQARLKEYEMNSKTPTVSELLANPQWVAEYGDISHDLLVMIAEDQAERAAKYFRNVALQKE